MSMIPANVSSTCDPSPETPPAQGASMWDVCKGVAIIPMLIWPWVFFAVAFHSPDGLALNPTVQNITRRNGVETTWVVTNIANVSAFLVTFLFQSAVKTFLVILVASEPTKISRVAFVSAAKTPSQSVGEVDSPCTRASHIHCVILLGLGWIHESVNAATYSMGGTLGGMELDFTSDESECLLWFDQNAPSTDLDCRWKDYNGFSFSQCLDLSQMVDILESGQNNIHSSIANNNDTATFDQLGGVQFATPIRGVLPNGPDGIPGFDTLSKSPLTDGTVNSALSFEYTLNLQGIATNVSCAYTADSPVVIWELTGKERGYNGTCPVGQSILTPPVGESSFPVYLNDSDLLGFWACNTSSETSTSYDPYFRGEGRYNETIGNLTCTVTSARYVIFPVTYTSPQGRFSTSTPIFPEPDSYPDVTIIDSSTKSIGDIVWISQGYSTNSVAELVVSFGVIEFGLVPYARDDRYLDVLAHMVQGFIEYQATYYRLLFTSSWLAAPTGGPGLAPESCLRQITGTVAYNVTGWKPTWQTAAYLIPSTLINLTSIILLVVAARRWGWRPLPTVDPTDSISVLGTVSRSQLPVQTSLEASSRELEGSQVRMKYERKGTSTDSPYELKLATRV
ncbi:hypothetical protein JAAARDRAFT_49841 [Jaapia argillacea MUCL 33604]|uniref:Uncharacterized protein n=1 Tax=Jaapia argillacea MUCL 33604 TaxID=933084 RepID=A0A067PHR5_9AGAM|nr:hypothetical protein JAAARDRAFT_49841 [Jaapia argillacea MUCL 33604]